MPRQNNKKKGSNHKAAIQRKTRVREEALSQEPSTNLSVEDEVADVQRMLAKLTGRKAPAEVYVDKDGLSYCDEHRLEHCDICCLSFGLPNNFRRHELKSGRSIQDDDKAFKKITEKDTVKNGHRLMSMLAANGDKEIPFGSSEATALDQKVNKTCQHCGKTEGKMLRCSKCKIAVYCGAQCQKEAWKDHKVECKVASQRKYMMGNVVVPPPDDPRWSNPTVEDLKKVRRALESGHTANDYAKTDPMLSGWMLPFDIGSLDIEEEIAKRTKFEKNSAKKNISKTPPS